MRFLEPPEHHSRLSFWRIRGADVSGDGTRRQRQHGQPHRGQWADGGTGSPGCRDRDGQRAERSFEAQFDTSGHQARQHSLRS